MGQNSNRFEANKKIIAVAIGIILIASIIVVGIILSNPQPSNSATNNVSSSPTPKPTSTPTKSSPNVSVVYSTLSWGYTYPTTNNQAYLVLSLTITNNGYTDGVPIYPDNPLSLSGFGLTINNVSYSPAFAVTISNSSSILGMSLLSPTLQSVTLMNGGSTSGTIIFQVPSSQYEQPFRFKVQC